MFISQDYPFQGSLSSPFVQDIAIFKPNPGILYIGTEASAEQQETREIAGDFWVATNATYSNSTYPNMWTQVNASLPSYATVYRGNGNVHRLTAAAAAPHPIVWTQIYQLGPTGILTLNNGSAFISPSATYAFEVGIPGSNSSGSLCIANNSTGVGSAHYTELVASVGDVVGTISGEVLLIADKNAADLVTVDHSGNVGVLGTIHAAGIAVPSFSAASFTTQTLHVNLGAAFPSVPATYSVQVGIAGTDLSGGIEIANNSPGVGSLKYTDITSSNSNTVAGVVSSVLLIADRGNGNIVAIDSFGDFGIGGQLSAGGAIAGKPVGGSIQSFVSPGYDTSGAAVSARTHYVSGIATVLNGNQSVTVNLSGTAAFSSSSSYVVVATVRGGPVSPHYVLTINNVSGSQFLIYMDSAVGFNIDVGFRAEGN